MSMHYDGEQGYGMFRNKEETKTFVHTYAEKEDVDEDMWEIYSDLGASNLCDDEYDMRHVMHLDGKKHEEDNDVFVDGVFLYAKKQGSVVRDEKLTDRTYASLSEMAEEFHELYGGYLPSDFDYAGHLCHFLGANFG